MSAGSTHPRWRHCLEVVEPHQAEPDLTRMSLRRVGSGGGPQVEAPCRNCGGEEVVISRHPDVLKAMGVDPARSEPGQLVAQDEAHAALTRAAAAATLDPSAAGIRDALVGIGWALIAGPAADTPAYPEPVPTGRDAPGPCDCGHGWSSHDDLYGCQQCWCLGWANPVPAAAAAVEDELLHVIEAVMPDEPGWRTRYSLRVARAVAGQLHGLGYRRVGAEGRPR